MSAILTTSFTSNHDSHFINSKKPFTVKLDRLYKEVVKVAETEPNQYADFRKEKKLRRTHQINLSSFSSLNDEIGKTKLSLLTGKTITFNGLFSSKEKKPQFNNKAKEVGYIDKMKLTVDSMRQIKKSLRKTNGFTLSSRMFKSAERKGVLCELKGNNDFIEKMKKSFPEYLIPVSSFISSETPNTQRIRKIKNQLSK